MPNNRTRPRLRPFALAAATILLGFAAGFAAGPSQAAPLQVRISTAAVPGDYHMEMWYVFKEWLERSAPGEFAVEVHHSGTLFKQGTEPAAMMRGNLEMASPSIQDVVKLVPEYNLLTAGYLLRDLAHQKAVYTGPIGQDLYSKISANMKMTVLSYYYNGTRQLNLRQVRNVRTPADLKGLKLRMPGSKEWLFLGQALGGEPTPLAFNEVYLALQTGTIDGQDNPLPTNEKAKFYEVTKQIVMTDHMIDTVFIAVSNILWDKLNPTQKEKMREAARAASEFNDLNKIRDERVLVEFFKSKGQTVTIPDKEAFRNAVQKAYLSSEFAKDWPAGLLDKVNATGR
ncbi:MAG: DctP family TRAP transporter solute-binding subunit [Alphaproteobacteria bacterium]|nr:DctP family TRAP transporter solute-binding subunit [Alphaproteobacteria bacterium]